MDEARGEPVDVMTALSGGGDVDGFRGLVSSRLGLRFDDAKLGFLTEVLRRRFEANGQSCDAYLAQLKADSWRSELGALAKELTVGETYFFRNIDQFRALTETVLPDRMRAQEARRALRILSAGCASGEEAYSIAILVRQALSGIPWNVSIRGVDINPAALEKAARARFSSWALRETPSAIQSRWFRQEGRELLLEESIRDAVRFEEMNLADEDVELWEPGAYDVVFCRNVIMYFTPERARLVVARIARSLVRGGYLFLGHAETLRGLSRDFHLRHTQGTFYYQLKDSIDREEYASPNLFQGAAPSSTFVPATVPLEADDTWVHTIRNATERIQMLARKPVARVSSTAASLPVWDLAPAFELLLKERFVEALDVVQAFPSGSEHDPDVLLMRAVLLAHSGRLGSAEETCRRLLAIDGLNAGAHYVLALCREDTGDRKGARDHDDVAAYLDPSFSMPKLHAGLMARRAGDRDLSRRELSQALVLLQREDASRLLLFGGGFGREALTALCRAELNACGGES